MSPPTFTDKRASAVRYWETRRLGFNLMLIPPGVCGWLGYISTVLGAGSPEVVEPMALILPVLLALVVVNLAYSAVYALEFLLMCEGESRYWLTRGRDLTFAAGSIAVFGLVFLAGARFAAHITSLGN